MYRACVLRWTHSIDEHGFLNGFVRITKLSELLFKSLVKSKRRQCNVVISHVNSCTRHKCVHTVFWSTWLEYVVIKSFCFIISILVINYCFGCWRKYWMPCAEPVHHYSSIKYRRKRDVHVWTAKFSNNDRKRFSSGHF